ncbi:MAG: type II secretion system protein [Armatimonadetes bacterium]|nr:type II secretion system protein [Armatimonadota bacterium]
MKRKGFTLTEVLVILTILAVLAALLFPVLRRATERGKEVTCLSNFRQMHIALELYRADYEGAGRYGEAAAMGMPPTTLWLIPYGYDPREMRCPGISFTNQVERALYMEMWGGKDWVPTVTEFEDDTVIYIDLNHSFPGRSIYSESNTHRAIGLYLGGHIETRIRTGSPDSLKWWSPSG